MHNRCCVNGCFFNNSSNAHVHQLLNKWSAQLYFTTGIYILFTWKTHCGLKFHCGQIDRIEIFTKLSFTLPELIRMQIMKLRYIEVKFYPKVKSQTESHVNVLLVITVFHNFCRVAFNVCFETTNLSSALNFHYNEKISAEWASFWIIFRKKTNFILNCSCVCFPYLKYFRILWIYASNECKNEYNIFCKEHNIKSKNNKSRLPWYWMAPEQLYI